MDLSQWDFETEFTKNQIAALILGIDPLHPQSLDLESPVVRRLESAYRDGIRKCMVRHSNKEGQSKPDYGGNDLVGGFVEVVEGMALRGSSEEALYDVIEGLWDRSSEDSFPRKSVVRWLKATELKSVYQFELVEFGNEPEKPAATRWPWGDHHTEALGHLEAAARRFWGANYDSTDPTTAPKNADLVEWLTGRGVSDNMAKSIASILRADNLRTGPR
jgi:hypothetical protein